MMKIGYFKDQNFGVYLAANKIFDHTQLPCLLQTQILYKSAMKCINLSNESNGRSGTEI